MWQLPNGNFSNGNFPNVQFPKLQIPKSALAREGRPSCSARPPLQSTAPAGGLTKPLGSCRLGKCESNNEWMAIVVKEILNGNSCESNNEWMAIVVIAIMNE